MTLFSDSIRSAVPRIPASARAAAALLSVALLLPAFQAPPTTPKAEQAAGQSQERKGSIEGIVVDVLSGKPVKDINLLLARSGAMAAPNSAKSDEEGRFSFKGLDAGGYVLIGDHPKYARQTYGSRNGLLGGTILTLATGQGIKDLTFKLQPNAVASGRVLDEEDEPLPRIMVLAVKGMYQRGRRQLIPVGNAMTNDLGEFRLANLAPGRYLVSATLMKPPGAAAKPSGDEPEQAYLTTYYPNSPDRSGATPVEVTAGGDIGGLDIRLAKTKAVRITGKVTGAPKDQKINVRLVPKDAGMLAMITGLNASIKQEDGTFEIVGATPGSYTLRVSDPTGIKPLGAGMQIEVGDKRIEGIVLDATPGGDLAGEVVVAGDGKTSLKGTRILLEALSGVIMMPPNTAVSDDGTFALKDVPPDKYLVRVMTPPSNTYVESVLLGRQEMAEEGLELGAAGAEKLAIKLQPGAAQVDGVIRGQDDKPISGVTVALIPASKRYLLYQSTFTDQNGAFNFKGVTPGDYKLLAWEEIEPNAFQDPEFLKPFESKAESLSLKRNDQKAVSMKAIPRDGRTQ